jgi:hypothetical protein
VENAKKQIREVYNTSLSDSGGINPYLDYQALRREFATCWNAVAK